MRGRKKKPTAILKLQGNPGKRPLNKNEPKIKGGYPSCPNHLRGAARWEWERMQKHMESLNMVTPVDRAALAMYCQAYGRWVKAEREVERLGEVYKTKSGNVIQSPYLGIANRAMELAHKFLSEFGMTPASRARLSVPHIEDDEMKAWEREAETRKVKNAD